MAPKDKSERIRLIAWWGARRTSHLGPALLRHLRFEIGRRGWAGGTMLMTLVSSVHDPKIMLGMLVKVLRGDSIATRGRLARKDNVTFEDLMRGTSDFDVRTVTIEGLTLGAVSVADYGRDCYRYCDHAVGWFVLVS